MKLMFYNSIVHYENDNVFVDIVILNNRGLYLEKDHCVVRGGLSSPSYWSSSGCGTFRLLFWFRSCLKNGT